MRRRGLRIVVALLVVAATVGLLNVLFAVRPEVASAPKIPVRHVPDPLSALLELEDGDCVASATVDSFLDVSSLDITLTLQPWLRGWIEVADRGIRVYYGAPDEAVAALGGTEIAIGPTGEIWFRTGPGEAEMLWGAQTPMGRVVWLANDSASANACQVPA